MPRLLRHPALRPLKRSRTRSTRVSNTYFDSPDYRLQRDGVALRVRRIGRRWVQTLKGPPQSGAGLHTRTEYEWPLETGGPDLSRVAATPWKKLVTKAEQDGGLAPVCATEYVRQIVELEFPDGTRAQMCVDRGEIRALRGGRPRSAPIAEVELELESGDAANLFRLGVALAADLPVAVMTQSKEERGYALCRGLPLAATAPARAADVALDADGTATEMLAAIARECLRQIAANAQGLVTADDPEWVHQMRVGTRRLRSCLALMKPFCVEAELEPVVAETKWLASLLGTARDLDVFVTETLPPLAAWFARDASAAPGIKRLRERAARRRRTARSRARVAVASTRFQRLLLVAGSICATPRLGAASDASPRNGAGAADARRDSRNASARASDFASKLLARRHRKFADLAKTLEHAGNDERHAARIAAKRLRYVAEFFSPLFPGKTTKTYLKTLAATQEALGQFNDAVTAARLAGELSGAADPAAAGAVRGWVAAQAAAIEPALEKAVRRFNAAKPFWPAK